MKWKFAFLLSLISFVLFDKWWYASVVDGTDEFFYGFPLPYNCQEFHTSLSEQFFLTEFLIDFAVRLLFWITVVFVISRFNLKINNRVRKFAFVLTLIPTIIMAGLAMPYIINPDNVFYFKRPFEIAVMETGYGFVWSKLARPDYYKYHPEQRPRN